MLLNVIVLVIILFKVTLVFKVLVKLFFICVLDFEVGFLGDRENENFRF